MGTPEVSKISAAQAHTPEKKQEITAQKSENKAELSQALSKGQTSKGKFVPAKLEKKEGLSTGAKIGIGAAALLAAGTVLKFIKPSAGKALTAAAKLASHTPKQGLKAGHAVAAAGTLAGTAIATGCSEGMLDEVHNHFTELPTDTIRDTITNTEYVEKIIEKPIYITKTDTIVDTIKVPEIIHTTDTIWETKLDTQYVDKPVYIEVPVIVHETDTIWETKIDTQYVDRPIYIEVPGETIYVKEDFESEVPEKMKEMLHDLGIDTTGVGKFVYGLDWQDAKNNKVHRTLWDGGRTSRDGDVYIMNDIGTKWSNPDEAYVLGKNEEFKRHELYLNSSKELNDCENTPVSPINVSNNNGTPNWFIFDPEQSTAEPGNWLRQTPRTFTKISDGVWQSSDGFTYERGQLPNSIKKTNQYGSEWLLKDISIIGGNEAKDPK